MEEESENDLFICGCCKQEFTDLLVFVRHKQSKICKTFRKPNESEVPLLLTLNCNLANGTQVLTPPSRISNSTPEELTIPVSPLGIATMNPATSTECLTALSSKSLSDKKKRFFCSVEGCTFRTAYSKDLNRHHRKHTGERPFSCNVCGSAFSREDKLLAHTRTHSGEKPFKCSLCDYSCVENGMLRKHSRVHNGERPYKCQICPYSAKEASQLTIHLRIHTGDAPYSCPCVPCSKTFKTQSDLKRHIRLHTGEKPFACSLCDYKCAISSNLRVHVRNSHAPKKAFDCAECNFTSTTKRDYRSHLKTHSDQFFCELCEFKAASMEEYKTHIKVKHNSKPYNCRHCGATFMQIHVIRTHVRKEHPEFCSKGQPKVKPSKPKIVVSTKNPKPYACPQCPMSFVLEDSLKSHLRMHSHLQPPLEYKSLPISGPKTASQQTNSVVNVPQPLLVTLSTQAPRVMNIVPWKNDENPPNEQKEALEIGNHSVLVPVYMEGHESGTSQHGSVIMAYMPTGHAQSSNMESESDILSSLNHSQNQELTNLTSEHGLGGDVLLSLTDENGKVRYVYPRNLIAVKDNGDGRGPTSLEAVIHMTVGEGAELHSTQLPS